MKRVKESYVKMEKETEKAVEVEDIEQRGC